MASIIKILFSADDIEECEVIALNYKFEQNVDNIGQVAGEVQGGQITVILGTDGSNTRFGWMVDSTMKKNGKITFVDAAGQTAKTLSFFDAYCVGYKEDYDAFSPSSGNVVSIKEGARERLVISSRELDLEGEIHANTWIAGRS